MEFITPRLRIREFNTYEREFVPDTETRQSLGESISTQVESPRTIYRMAITVPPSVIAIGVIKISSHNAKIREWEVGWAVHPDKWDKGYATEAARKMIDWAFDELNIHRMVAFCHADNAASVRVMEKLGMQRDGRLRETRWLNGAWWDEYVYAILDRDWKRQR